MQYVRMLKTYAPTANMARDLCTFPDDVLAFQLQEAEVLEIVGKARFAELHAEQMRQREAAGAPQGPRVIVKLRERYGLNNKGEIASFPAPLAEQMIRQGQADKLGVVED